MQKIFLLSVFLFFLVTVGFAQQFNIDSLSLIVKISENQLKLGKLLNTVDQKTRDKKEAADKAQVAADNNSTAANDLTNHPDDKKLAKAAANTASDAKSDSRKSRKEADQLDQLNKDIRDIKSKIAADQDKLNRFIQVTGNAPVLPVTPANQTDTTSHRS